MQQRPQLAHPVACRREVGHLQHQHVSAIAAAALQQTPGGGVGPDRRHHLEKRVLEGEHGIAQPEVLDAGIGERLTQAQRAAQLAGDLVQVVGGDHRLAQARKLRAVHAHGREYPVPDGLGVAAIEVAPPG